ncbi:RlpA-like double-psi beta-barrel-protein domain-containing protein-containing protein [Paraphysoderma sedebokerense]|nr:RlpA-like double-psi beta-barrel-protein domain-containing protein-containing protein [Paraphysoderma sedebokerense]
MFSQLFIIAAVTSLTSAGLIRYQGFATYGVSDVGRRRLVKRANGFATYYTKGSGACGLYDDEKRMPNVAALNAIDYGSPTWKGPQCGKCVSVKFENGATGIFKITDRCPGDGNTCKSGDLDLNEEAFPSDLKEKGRVQITWSFVDCNGGSAPTPSGDKNQKPPTDEQSSDASPTDPKVEKKEWKDSTSASDSEAEAAGDSVDSEEDCE